MNNLKCDLFWRKKKQIKWNINGKRIIFNKTWNAKKISRWKDAIFLVLITKPVNKTIAIWHRNTEEIIIQYSRVNKINYVGVLLDCKVNWIDKSVQFGLPPNKRFESIDKLFEQQKTIRLYIIKQLNAKYHNNKWKYNEASNMCVYMVFRSRKHKLMADIKIWLQKKFHIHIATTKRKLFYTDSADCGEKNPVKWNTAP